MDHQRELQEAAEKRRGKEQEAREEAGRRFGGKAPSDYGERELREKHVASLLSDKSPRLSPKESLALLLYGNAEHVAALEHAPMTPGQRYRRILQGEADYLVIGCSDSRNVRMDSESDRIVGLFIRIAGNVVPPKGSA